MAYDHVIAYALLAFVGIGMEVMLNYLSARELWHKRIHFYVMCRAVHASGWTILYVVKPHHVFIVFSVFSLLCYSIRCSVFLTSLEGDSYYWQWVSSPYRLVKATIIKRQLIVNDGIKLIFIFLCVIGQYVVQFIRLLTPRRPSICISVAMAG